MPNKTRIAIIDVGKTTARLLIADADGAVRWSAERACRAPPLRPEPPALASPQPVAPHGVPSAAAASRLGPGTAIAQLDVAGIEDWLLEQLCAAPDRQHIQGIVPIAHGAAAVLVDEHGELLSAPDYEERAFDAVAADYRAARDPYAATFSPWLPFGLNLGRQLFYLQQRDPDRFARCRSILLYPQYWAWRLGGVMACELTSLGCHSDLWRIGERAFSKLAVRSGWAEKFPPLHAAWDRLGSLLPKLARRTGLDPDCRILCGMHDSSASFLKYRVGRPADQPFAVVSSGTWTVIMAHAAGPMALAALRPERDMLANIDAYGAPVATARFMGGREFAAIAGPQDSASNGHNPPPDALVARLIAQKSMALPAFAEAGGPFAAYAGRLVGAAALSPPERLALAAIYIALMTDLLLDWLGITSEVIVDGPLSQNALYCRVLAGLRPTTRVHAAAQDSAQAVVAALFLAGIAAHAASLGEPVAPWPLPLQKLADYRSLWRSQLPILAPDGPV